MRVAVYTPGIRNLEHSQVLEAFAEGVGYSGDYAELRNLGDDHPQDTDIAVVFGVRKHAVPLSSARGDVIDAYQDLGKRVVILEKGYVKRDEYYAAGWDNLNGRADFMNQDMPIDRWIKLDTELRPLHRNESGPIVVIAQVPWDASVQHTNHIAWLAEAISRIQQYTDRDIVLRPHPLAITQTPVILGSERSVCPLQDDLDRAYAVVTFNSNTGVDALINGLPVYCFDPGSMIKGMAEEDIRIIDNPIWPRQREQRSREQWAANLAYAQWSLKEMASGLAWKHLREGALK